ncbi:MFS general substrate transporter [Hypoxylon sp. FL0890]|nr:MFS general substrate transporter [Hypoxylon sp. FL0890]
MKIPYWRLVIDQAGVTPEVANFQYEGSGTEADPYVVKWIPDDPRNPMNFSPFRRWLITGVVAFATLAVALVSSAYSGGVAEIIAAFHISQEIAILGVSVFVVGFAVGPLLWAPLSELFGRQLLFFLTYGALTAFNAGCAGAQNAQTLMVLRFFAGAFGSSPLTNAGGVIADMFTAAQRGQAMAIFAAAPFLGPVLGPIIGGFLGVGAGWRWVMGFLAAFSGTLWLLGTFLVPETYAPVLLRRRAAKLSKMTGKHYVSIIDRDQGRVALGESFKIALSRPWILLFREPIVFLLSIYMAIVYGTLYMLFAAFPIVYQENRGWSSGIGGLAFLGILVGMVFAIAYTFPDNNRYIRVQEKHGGFAPPETRLTPTMVASVFLPLGLFWFAWTNYPSIHWMASISAGVPFGFGMVLVFLSIMNYLIDAYTIFAASVLAANSVLRSLFGAAFPLFTTYMYQNLGIHWASSIPAFLALACVPFPFLFYKYGAAIRKRCKFAAQSAAFVAKLAEAQAGTSSGQEESEEEKQEQGNAREDEKPDSIDDAESRIAGLTPSQALRTRTNSWATADGHGRPLSRSRTYEGNPYDIDRVNTRESFA